MRDDRTIANNTPVDIWHYPDSNKWGFSTGKQFFRRQETDYFDGEE